MSKDNKYYNFKNAHVKIETDLEDMHLDFYNIISNSAKEDDFFILHKKGGNKTTDKIFVASSSVKNIAKTLSYLVIDREEFLPLVLIPVIDILEQYKINNKNLPKILQFFIDVIEEEYIKEKKQKENYIKIAFDVEDNKESKIECEMKGKASELIQSFVAIAKNNKDFKKILIESVNRL